MLNCRVCTQGLLHYTTVWSVHYASVHKHARVGGGGGGGWGRALPGNSLIRTLRSLQRQAKSNKGSCR